MSLNISLNILSQIKLKTMEPLYTQQMNLSADIIYMLFNEYAVDYRSIIFVCKLWKEYLYMKIRQISNYQHSPAIINIFKINIYNYKITGKIKMIKNRTCYEFKYYHALNIIKLTFSRCIKSQPTAYDIIPGFKLELISFGSETVNMTFYVNYTSICDISIDDKYIKSKATLEKYYGILSLFVKI